MQHLTWTCLHNNFILRATFITSYVNYVADALSPFKFQEFKTMCPQAKPAACHDLYSLLFYLLILYSWNSPERYSPHLTE